jgi:hypothetical protein
MNPQATKLRRGEERPIKRVAIVARLKKGSETRARELIAEGPPFNLVGSGFIRHSVYLSASEVVFVFEGNQINSQLYELVDDRSYPLGQALEQWRAIVDGRPRIAHERFEWDRDDGPPAVVDVIAGSGSWA